MKAQGPPSYGDIRAALERVSSPMGASGCHGLLCGMLAAQPGTPLAQWQEEVMPDGYDPADLLAAEAADMLGELFDHTLMVLSSPDMGFEPLLPGADATILERGTALAQWCDGFLYGLGIAGYQDRAHKGAEAREFVADVGEIAKLRITEGHEEDERALAELIEYIRVGVLLVSTVPVSPGGPESTLH